MARRDCKKPMEERRGNESAKVEIEEGGESDEAREGEEGEKATRPTSSFTIEITPCK